MSKFIELTLADCGDLKKLINIDSISVVDGVASARVIFNDGSSAVYEESYEEVKSLISGKQRPKVTAEELIKASEAWYIKDCTSCEGCKYNHSKSTEVCKTRFVADYINEGYAK